MEVFLANPLNLPMPLVQAEPELALAAMPPKEGRGF